MKPLVFEDLAFPQREVVPLTDLSAWQLASWAEDLVVPSIGELYSFRDLVELRTLRRLLEMGLDTHKLRKATEYLRRYSDRPWSDLKLGVAPKKTLALWDSRSKNWISASGKKLGQVATGFAVDEVAQALKRDVGRSRTRPKELMGTFEQTRGVCGNRERFAGTRVLVSQIRDAIRAGATTNNLLKQYPTLDRKDIEAARKLP